MIICEVASVHTEYHDRTLNPNSSLPIRVCILKRFEAFQCVLMKFFLKVSVNHRIVVCKESYD